jgi:hypothetical protein
MLDINMILDPRAWAMKYLIAASVSWFVLEFVIMGINLSMLISIAIHRKIQFVLDRAMMELIRRMEVVISINGVYM